MSHADFISPKGYKDHIGFFGASCFDCDALAHKYEDENDDYSKILAQSLADRFVEAFAEYLNRQISIDLRSYAKDKNSSESDLLKIEYDGICPAPGYPSQPDYTEKRAMWDLVKVKENAVSDPVLSLSVRPLFQVVPSTAHRQLLPLALQLLPLARLDRLLLPVRVKPLLSTVELSCILE